MSIYSEDKSCSDLGSSACFQWPSCQAHEAVPAVRALSPPTFSRQLAATPPDDVVLSGGGAAGAEPAAVAPAPATDAMDAAAEEEEEEEEEEGEEGVAMEAEAGPHTRRHVIRHVLDPRIAC